ncbi:MAG: Asp-tRNA(Asn)/Glu-tRNA(Gln) amidotransferase subunit GatB [Firmicutes bacterium]|nr:Asp-tRNA(Asn)/Glu-tRNA(Gln) amidotransferase subunit GatB [Bacillota bacterium]
MEDYEIVIGLEVHAELLTESKLFCGCSTKFGAEPNTHVCPVCLGLPGVLPVLNEKAVEYAVRAGLALNCEIASFSKFDRKNYFYPDLPKAYQISQYDLPLCRNGWVEIALPPADENSPARTKRIGIIRVHLEEEAGKSVHSSETIVGSEYSLEDYNRVGIPLIEIVSKPDIRSPQEARLYAESLRTILLYAGVSDCKMEEGSLRVDANISLRPRGATEFGTRTEIKNINSFRSIERALAYEAARQAQVLDEGGQVVQETRAWDELHGVTVAMRSKEEAQDYRYFPEPDLVPVVTSREWVEKIRASLPELPLARQERFQRQYGLPAYDAALLTETRDMADFFEEAARQWHDPKAVANWLMGDFTRLLKEHGLEVSQSRLRPGHLVGMLKLMEKGVISGKIAKTVFEEMFLSGQDAEQIVKDKGLVQIADTGELEGIIQRIIAANPQPAEDFRKGKEKALGFFVGQVMRETKGRANPALVNELLRKLLTAGQ